MIEGWARCLLGAALPGRPGLPDWFLRAALASTGMMDRVKKFATALPGRLGCSPLTVALLDASSAGQATPFGPIELLVAGASEPPEWVRFMAPGVNKARDGRSFTVDDPARIVQLSNAYKGSIDLLVDYEHQFDRAAKNGQPAPAAGWIKELSATGPDGTPGIWARVEWVPAALSKIKAREYRYLSAAIAYDDKNVVQFVPRASLVNHPALDTATALFSAHPNQEHSVNLLQKMLAAFGLAATTPEDDAVKHATGLATLCAALAKLCGVEVAALSAMTADQVAAGLAKPLETKLATLSAAASLGADASADAILAAIRAKGVDPTKYIARSVYDDVAGRLATLTADAKTRLIEEGSKAGKLTPAMAKEFATTLDHAQLSAFLEHAPVIVAPGSGGGGSPQGDGKLTVATMSAEHKAEADRMGVQHQTYVDTFNESAAT